MRGVGIIPIENVQIGDFVRDGPSSFSRVFSLGHDDHETETEYIQLFANTLSRPLEVTPRHFVLLANSEMVTASVVQVGDKLSGNHTVTRIHIIERRGLFAPLTESGYIQVSGVVASNYAALLDISPLLLHQLSHVFLAPVRWACYFDFDVCKNETYTNGNSDWGYHAVWFVALFQSFCPPMQLFAVLVTGPLLVALSYPLPAVLVATSMFFLGMVRQRKQTRAKHV